MRSPLERLSDGVGRIDALRDDATYRLVGVVVGLTLCAGVLVAPAPPGLEPTGQRALAVTCLMALWWLGGVLPITVTALVPLVAFPGLGIATVAEAARPYGHPLIFLMLGGFLLGQGMERVALHERLTALLLRPAAARRSPRNVVWALMLSGAVFSALVSNTATMVMMLPLALLLAERCGSTSRAGSGFALALAYACSIGGVSTLIGTFPNAVFAQVARDQVGVEISFASWMTVGVPFVLVALPVAWLVVSRMLVPAEWADDTGVEAPPWEAWRPGERSVLAVVGIAMLAWLTRRSVDLGFVVLPGWSDSVGFGAMVDDAWVAVFAGCALFALPGGVAPDGRRRALLVFRDVERRIPWSVLFLLGGGFSLANVIKTSGLTEWLAGGTAVLATLPIPVALLLLCLSVSFLTELTSNTATTQILLPLLAAGAVRADVDPLLWMVPATISASCAFMMPVATPPNALAAEGAKVSPGDMASAGLVLNIALACVAAAISALWMPLVLG